jgi:sec-independent protein translocase protein TatA
MFTGILQPTHLIVLLVIALVVLGPKRLPDAGRALGQGLKEFKDSIGAHHDEDRAREPSAAITEQSTPSAGQK